MTKSILLAFLSLSLLVTSDLAFAGGKPGNGKCQASKSCKSQLCVRQNPTDKFGTCCTPTSCVSLGAQCGSIDNGCGGEIQCNACELGNTCVDNQCEPDPTTTTTTTTSTTSTTMNPCDPDPCTSCGFFQFFWCVAYDGNQECIFNSADSGSCNTTADCGDDAVCAYQSYDGTKRCITILNVCPTTSTTIATTTTTEPPTTTTTEEPATTTTTVPSPSNSCEGICGSQAPGGCYCDINACTYNDGCADRVQFCGSPCP